MSEAFTSNYKRTAQDYLVSSERNKLPIGGVHEES